MAHTIMLALTPDEFKEKEAELATHGFNITGNQGELEKSGVKIAYNYDGTSVLKITIEKKPWVVSESYVEQKIQEWFRGNAG